MMESFASTSAPASPPASQTLGFQFSGQGSDYFRIWMVNIVLSIITLGIYSAWGKVRIQKYLHGHTKFADASFDYHGKPLAILKGRLIVTAVIVVSGVLGQIWFGADFLIYAVLMLLLPWMTVMALRFRLRNASWQQMRFNFRAGAGKAVFPILVGPIITILSLGMAGPYVMHVTQQFVVNHSWFGNAAFKMKSCVGEYYVIALKAMLATMVAFMAVFILFLFYAGISFAAVFSTLGDDSGFEGLKAALGVGFLLSIVAIYVVMLLLYMAIISVMRDMMVNQAWNQATLEHGEHSHRFVSTMQAFALIKIHLTNLILMVITLGLYYPWAKLRLLRYKLSCLTLITQGSLEEIRAQLVPEGSALGDAALDGFELDIGL